MKKRICSVTGGVLEIDWGPLPGTIDRGIPHFGPPPNASVTTTFPSHGGGSVLGNYPPIKTLCFCHGLPVMEVDD
jgi:hypothetical protein